MRDEQVELRFGMESVSERITSGLLKEGLAGLFSVLFLMGLCLTAGVHPAQAQTRLSVVGAGQLYPIALPKLCLAGKGSDQLKASTDIPDIMGRDLLLSGYFRVVSQAQYIDTGEGCSDPNEFAYSDWTVIGVDGLVRGVVSEIEDGKVKVQMYLYDVQLRKPVLGKEYSGTPDQIRPIAHRFANEIMKFFTGTPGVFGTQIAFTGRVGRFKELFVMDMDGSNVRQVTRERGLSLFPAWSPEGGRLTYTGYRVRQPDVFMVDLSSRRVSQITNDPTLEVAPKLAKDGRSLLVSRSAGRNSDVVLSDLRGNVLRRVTPRNGAIDVSADFSPDGNQIVFVSNRAGSPQIYVMGSDGTGVRRVSYAESNYCTSPSWSPTGSKIAFVCRADGGYNVFTANPDGSDAFQLTSGGVNEDPTWSPDGNFVAFSSTAHRSRVKKIALIRADGSNFQVLNGGRTEELDPAWGPRLY